MPMHIRSSSNPFPRILATFIVAYAFSVSAAPVHAAPKTEAEARAKVDSLRKQLKEAEAQLALLTAKSTSTPAVAPPPNQQIPIANPAQATAAKRDAVNEASNRFLDYLIVISFLAVAISFIGARYRDSKAPSPAPGGNAQEATSTPSDGGAVVYYSKADSTAGPGTVAVQTNQVNQSETADVTDTQSNESDHGPDSSEPDNAESQSASDEEKPTPDLRVEPKRKSRGGKN